MQHDLPTMNAGAYASSSTLLGQAGWIGGAGGAGLVLANNGGDPSAAAVERVLQARRIGGQKYIEQLIKEQEEEVADKRRIVKVFIVDTDKNIPLEQCVLYSGEEKLTDAQRSRAVL